MKVIYNNKVQDINLTKTEIYVQRQIILKDGNNEFENCYVYIDENKKIFIQENDSEYNWFNVYDKNLDGFGIKLIDLKDTDIEIIKNVYKKTIQQLNLNFNKNLSSENL